MNARLKDPMLMAQQSAGTVLLKALVSEVRQLPKQWHAIPERDQRAVIDRLHAQVESAVEAACLMIASGGAQTVAATVESVTFKDGVKAVLTLSRGNPNTHALADATGGSVLLVMADSAKHVSGMNLVKPDPDQRDIEDAIVETSDKLESEEVAGGEGEAVADKDPLCAEVLSWVRESRITSVDAVQVQFKIDHPRAQLIMAALEVAGAVGPVRDDNSREILDEVKAEAAAEEISEGEKSPGQEDAQAESSEETEEAAATEVATEEL